MDKREMDIIRIQAERGGYTPPGQVAKLVAIIDDYERQISWNVTCSGCADQLDESYLRFSKNTLNGQALECLILAEEIEDGDLTSTLGPDMLRERARGHHEQAERLEQK